MSRPKSPAAMAREIERLQAQVAQLQAQISKHIQIYAGMAHELCDRKIRQEQAARILTGVDE